MQQTDTYWQTVFVSENVYWSANIIWCVSEAFPSHAKLWHISSLPLPKQQGYLEHHIPDSLCSSINPEFHQFLYESGMLNTLNTAEHFSSLSSNANLSSCYKSCPVNDKLRSINYLFLSTRGNRMFMHQGIIWHEFVQTPAVSIFLTKSWRSRFSWLSWSMS